MTVKVGGTEGLAFGILQFTIMASLYAVVDKSKKKKRFSLQEEKGADTHNYVNTGQHNLVELSNFDPEEEDQPHSSTPGSTFSALYSEVVTTRRIPKETALSTTDPEVEEQPHSSPSGGFVNALYYEVPTTSAAIPEAAVSTTSVARDEKTQEKNSSDGKHFLRIVCTLFFVAIALTLLFAVISLACIAILFIEIDLLKSAAPSSIQQEVSPSVPPINHSMNGQLAHQISLINESFLMFKELIPDNIEERLTTITETVRDILNNESQQFFSLLNNSIIALLEKRIEQLEQALHRVGQFANNPVSSCAALFPSSPSGYYWVRAYNGSAVHVYCDMNLSCGNITGGWMRQSSCC